MQHGRSLLRCRSAVRWTLFGLLLAGMGSATDALLPPSPRWVMHQESSVVGFSPDSRTLATVRPDGLLQLWDPANGKEAAQFFAGADAVWPLGFVPCYDN